MAVDQQEPAATPGVAIGVFYLWRPGDHLPTVPLPAGITVSPDSDATTHAAPGDRRYRINAEHDEVASGWISTQRARIGELGIDVPLPHGHMYLWGFATADAWRGQGLYPTLLQEFIRREGYLPGISHVWIGHDVGNEASASGILRAGFTPIAHVHHAQQGGLVLVPLPEHAGSHYAATCADVFHLPMAATGS